MIVFEYIAQTIAASQATPEERQSVRQYLDAFYPVTPDFATMVDRIQGRLKKPKPTNTTGLLHVVKLKDWNIEPQVLEKPSIPTCLRNPQYAPKEPEYIEVQCKPRVADPPSKPEASPPNEVQSPFSFFPFSVKTRLPVHFLTKGFLR